MHYLWWIPCVAVYYSIYAWMSKKNNDLGGSWEWMWKTYVFGALCPFWVLVTCVTKNIVLDAIIYDILMVASGIITMWFMGAADNFTIINWIGVVMTIAGLILIQT